MQNNAKESQVLISLRAGADGVQDMVKENHWTNDLGTKTKINKKENPFGYPNGCIEFAGGNDRMILHGNQPRFDVTDDWTISLWAKYSNLPAYTSYRGFGRILTHLDLWNTNNASLWFDLFLGDDVPNGCSPGISSYVRTSFDGNNCKGMPYHQVDFSKWNHIAWCYDSQQKKLYTFVNGKSVITTDCSTYDMRLFMANDNQPIAVGGDAYSMCYQGYVDDLVVINHKALWTQDFTPPTNYLIPIKQLYISKSNSVWGAAINNL